MNDLYGHHIGDLYLQEVALRMKRQLRSHDMLARLGGDEFAVLLPDGAQPRRCRGDRSAPGTLLRRSVRPRRATFCNGSASFGIALYPEDGATKDSLLSAADAAMYAAKTP